MQLVLAYTLYACVESIKIQINYKVSYYVSKNIFKWICCPYTYCVCEIAFGIFAFGILVSEIRT